MPRIFAGLALCSLALVAPPADAQEPELQTVTGESEPVYSDSVVEVYTVPTTHGTLYGEVVRPVVPDGLTVPAALAARSGQLMEQCSLAPHPTGPRSWAAGDAPNPPTPASATRVFANATRDRRCADLTCTFACERNTGVAYDRGRCCTRKSGAAANGCTRLTVPHPCGQPGRLTASSRGVPSRPGKID